MAQLSPYMGQPQTNCNDTFSEICSVCRVHVLLVKSTKLYIVICEIVLSDLSENLGYTLFVLFNNFVYRVDAYNWNRNTLTVLVMLNKCAKYCN